MLRLAGELLPLGLGVALNPVAVATVLLIIGGPDQRRNGSAFILGWVLGLTLLLVPVGLALATGWHRGQATHGELLRRAWQVAGAGMVVGGLVALWPRRRPEASEPPRWARRLHGAGTGGAAALGAGLAMFSLRNVLLVTGFALLVARSDLSLVGSLLAYACFVALATASLLVPVLMKAFGDPTAQRWLAAWQGWLARYGTQLAGLVIAVTGARLLAGR